MTSPGFRSKWGTKVHKNNLIKIKNPEIHAINRLFTAAVPEYTTATTQSQLSYFVP